jgi:hypothetical protein
MNYLAPKLSGTCIYPLITLGWISVNQIRGAADDMMRHLFSRS